MYEPFQLPVLLLHRQYVFVIKFTGRIFSSFIQFLLPKELLLLEILSLVGFVAYTIEFDRYASRGSKNLQGWLK
jgi:hypothetical protein